jgi:hypothetical protein
MRRLNSPIIDPAEIYDACVSGISDPALAGRFTIARAEVIDNFQKYGLQASTNELFSFIASARGKGEQQVLAGITKEEFVELYSKQMVGDGKPGRKYYDRLMMLAPHGKCPLCGFGQVSTLDHFLSKARYPAFSVLCTNLVPACTDCNKVKGASVVTPDTQMLHPYFEGTIVETEPWLFAEVIESAPAVVRYFVQPPDFWPGELNQRVSNYFSDLNLARRFGVEAAAEIAGLADLLEKLKTWDLIHAHLSLVAQVEREKRKNSWKAALYEALATSAWFLDGGYRNPGH